MSCEEIGWGEVQQKTAKRKHGERCFHCKRELSRTKGELYGVKPHRICNTCYRDKGLVKQEPPPPSPPPSTPQRKRTTPAPPVISPEQQKELLSSLKEAGIGKQGRSLSTSDRARVLLQVSRLQQQDSPMSFDKIVKAVATDTGSSPNTVRTTVKEFQLTGDAEPLAKKPRITIDDPLHMRFGTTGPSIEVQTVLHSLAQDAAENNKYISLQTMSATVFKATKIVRPIPKSTMHKWIQQLGYTHEEKKLTGLKASYSNALIRRYLLKYSLYVKQQRGGGAVLVYMDESYIHQGYCSK